MHRRSKRGNSSPEKQILSHPPDKAEPEINTSPTHPAMKEKVSTSSQNQALVATLFPSRPVGGRKGGSEMAEVERTEAPRACQLGVGNQW